MVKGSKYTQEEIAQKLEITARTLRRYQNGERTMPVDLFWKLILICRFYAIIPMITDGIDRYWHKRKSVNNTNTIK